MKSNIRRAATSPLAVLLLAGLAFAGLAGCEAQQKPAPAVAEAPRDGVTRAIAIQNAQRDAAFRYSELRVGRVDARKMGGFWVVELTGVSGAWLRYTISAADGSIRERNLIQ
jgi:hypothetical protein